jgi:hypothetical protein
MPTEALAVTSSNGVGLHSGGSNGFYRARVDIRDLDMNGLPGAEVLEPDAFFNSVAS